MSDDEIDDDYQNKKRKKEKHSRRGMKLFKTLKSTGNIGRRINENRKQCELVKKCL